MEARAKELGLWGLASKVKVVKSGNSLVVRIPSPLARYLRMKSGQEVLVTPDRANRLVLELT
jgi:antitoxin component of MazEF toxin-antitoxin module